MMDAYTRKGGTTEAEHAFNLGCYVQALQGVLGLEPVAVPPTMWGDGNDADRFGEATCEVRELVGLARFRWNTGNYPSMFNMIALKASEAAALIEPPDEEVTEVVTLAEVVMLPKEDLVERWPEAEPFEGPPTVDDAIASGYLTASGSRYYHEEAFVAHGKAKAQAWLDAQ